MVDLINNDTWNFTQNFLFLNDILSSMPTVPMHDCTRPDGGGQAVYNHGEKGG